MIVVDPIPTNRIRLTALLARAQYDVVAVPTPADALSLGADPALVILGAPADPSRALARLRSGFRSAAIVCLDVANSPMRRLAALRAGARDVLPRAVEDRLLLARLRNLLREGDTAREANRRRIAARTFGLAEPAAIFERPSRVLCLERPGGGLASLISIADGLDVAAADPAEVLRDADSGRADAYVLPPETGTGIGFDALLPELRDRSHSRLATILALYPEDRPELAVTALNYGATEIASDTSSGEELALRLKNMLARKRTRDRLRACDEQSYRLAATDDLTGLFNRRYAEAYLADLAHRRRGKSGGYVVMLVDIDHFKAVNDSHGHDAGDRVLRAVAGRLRDNVRAIDLVSRHGGEEFLIVLPDTGVEEARRMAERLRRTVGEAKVALPSGGTLSVTVSIGVSVRGDDAPGDGWSETGDPDSFSMIRAADTALYAAKGGGRNRVVVSRASA